MTELILKPGEIVKKSGQYEVIEADGKKAGREVTLVKGEHAPPTPKPGQKMRLADETKHTKKRSSRRPPIN